MQVLITGGQGFIGQALARLLLAAPGLADASGTLQALRALVLVDLAPATPPGDQRVRCVTGDVSDPALIDALLAEGPDLVFALGATLTAEAERDFERGLQVNLLGMLRLLEACRQRGPGGPPPRLVYASSIAAYGGALPETVADDTPRTPETSYGTHKAISELLINDYSRRGHVDGRAVRLPIVLARPPARVPSVSDRLAALLRDPPAGRDAACPWRPDTRVPVASVRAVARALLAVAALPAGALGSDRTVNLPSLSVTMAELVDAVARQPLAAGVARPGRVAWSPDPALQAVVDAWPQRLDSPRARALGVQADTTLAELLADALVGDH